ncbi:unnamed protein product [Linum tenue]|uniref:Uncharacterized protein n=1 Tax=Linum tenue TaxID=586396 RepID=A0AAV0RAI2_9ROSI|nr:unnamed protein product [Linum tenue]
MDGTRRKRLPRTRGELGCLRFGIVRIYIYARSVIFNSSHCSGVDLPHLGQSQDLHEMAVFSNLEQGYENQKQP